MTGPAPVSTVSDHGSSGVSPAVIEWISTDQNDRWRSNDGAALKPFASSPLAMSFVLRLDQPAQTIEGFGATFNERGAVALATLPEHLHEDALSAVFGDRGAALSHCRTPMGATDLSLDWYSYDETDGDFDMADFSIARDRQHLIPFIKSALALRPELKLWSSPWSPPTWMKTNRHYAMVPSWPGTPDNGITAENRGREGNAYFIAEDRYLEAYARYFARYVEAYAAEGIEVAAVMPQNEFNSAQPFPSCPWTPALLARFIPHLHREMQPLGVGVLLGTLERATPEQIDEVLADEEVASIVEGVGVQWAGKGALPALRMRHPDLRIWGTEQECGRGENDWRYTRYIWDSMKLYFQNGATVWTYWNTALDLPNVSGWGWPQNSLVLVDKDAGTFQLTNDYWLLRHFSAFVKPGARYVPYFSFMGYENQLAFKNPDGSVVVVTQNELSEPKPIVMVLGGKQVSATLPADSFNSFRIPAEALRG